MASYGCAIYARMLGLNENMQARFQFILRFGLIV